MAVVGTAYVRLRVIGDKLKDDLTTATKKAVDDSAPELNDSGKGAGEHVGEGMGKGVETTAREQVERIGDELGENLGRAMGDSLGKSLRRRIGDSVQRGLDSGKAKLTRVQTMFQPLSDQFDKFFGDKSTHWSGILSKALTSGIGLAVLAAPSILAFLGAAVGAVAATAITAISAIGPAFVGAGLVGVAAFGSIKIAAGLIGLALKQQTPALADYQNRLDAFKTRIASPVQAGLLSGFNAAMRISSPLIDSIQGQLTRFGMAAGDVAINLADAFRQPAQIAVVQGILDNITGAIKLATPGIVGLAEAFAVLLLHLGPITSFLGQLIGDMGQWVAQTINAAAASGQLDTFITRMFDSTRYFVGILVDFGAGIWNIFSAAHAASGGMMTNLHDIAQNFRAWTGDPANRDKMIDFFSRMRIISGEVLGVLKDLAKSALGALDSTNVGKFTDAMSTLKSVGGALGGVFEQIRANAGDKLQTMFKNLSDMLVELSNSGVIGTVASALSNLFAIITTILQIPGIGQLLAFGAGLLVIFKTVSLLWTVLGPVVNILWALGQTLLLIGEFFVAVFGAIPVIIAVVVGALIYFFAFTDTGRALVAAAVHGIVVAFEWCRDAIVAAFDWVVDKLGIAWDWIVNTATSLWNSLSGIFGSIGKSISGVWNTVYDEIKSILGNIVGFIIGVWNSVSGAVSTALGVVTGVILGVWSSIVGFLAPILAGIFGIVSAVFGGIVSVISTIMDILYQIFIRVWPILALPVRIFYGVVILIWQQIVNGVHLLIDVLTGIISAAWNWISAVISTTMAIIQGIITTVWTAISGFISGVVSTIVGWVVGQWNWLSLMVSIALDVVWGYIVNTWNTIYAFLAGLVGAIVGYVTDRWNQLVFNIQTALAVVWGVITSVWNTVSGFIGGVMDAINGRITRAWNGIVAPIREALSTVWGVVQDGWNRVVNFVQGALDRIGGIISNIWGGLENVGSGIVSGLKGAVNDIIGMVNTVIGGINGAINLANKLPGADISTIPPIPRLAKGGVAMPTAGGTLAIVAEAGRPERIEPLDSDGLSKRDHAILNVIANGGGGGASGTNVNVYLGTGQLVPLIAEVVEEREDRMADRITTGTKG